LIPLKAEGEQMDFLSVVKAVVKELVCFSISISTISSFFCFDSNKSVKTKD